MKHIFTISLCFLALSLSAQTEYPYPYNPDGNNDGLISLNDLMDLLALYGLEYNAGVLATDSISAIYYTGEMDYWDCTSSCVALRGNWKVLDHYLVGSYKEALLESPHAFVWLDHLNQISTNNNNRPPSIYKETWDETDGYFANNSLDCFCQTRTRADIEDINLCEGLEDECGVCNGEGAIYECGCTDIPEGDCDCNGSQLDAIGVCGGDCLEDLDGDGVCDPVLGPCEGQDFVSYHGYDYDIVETADGRCWFAENLKTNIFLDGTPISHASNPSEIDGLNGSYGEMYCCLSPSYINITTFTNASGSTYQDFATDTHESFEEQSHIYNFGAVISMNGLCPSGWHIPSTSEYATLSILYGPGSGFISTALGTDIRNSAPEFVEYNTSGFNLIYPNYYITSSGNINNDGSLQTIDLHGTVNQNSTRNKGYYLKSDFPDGEVEVVDYHMSEYHHVRCVKD